MADVSKVQEQGFQKCFLNHLCNSTCEQRHHAKNITAFNVCKIRRDEILKIPCKHQRAYILIRWDLKWIGHKDRSFLFANTSGCLNLTIEARRAINLTRISRRSQCPGCIIMSLWGWKYVHYTQEVIFR